MKRERGVYYALDFSTKLAVCTELIVSDSLI